MAGSMISLLSPGKRCGRKEFLSPLETPLPPAFAGFPRRFVGRRGVLGYGNRCSFDADRNWPRICGGVDPFHRRQFWLLKRSRQGCRFGRRVVTQRPERGGF